MDGTADDVGLADAETEAELRGAGVVMLLLEAPEMTDEAAAALSSTLK